MSRYFYFKNFPYLKVTDVKALRKKLKEIDEDYFSVKENFYIEDNHFCLTEAAEDDGINHFSPEYDEFEQFFNEIMPFLEIGDVNSFYVFDEEFPIMTEDLLPQFQNSKNVFAWKIFLRLFKIVPLKLIEEKQ